MPFRQMAETIATLTSCIFTGFWFQLKKILDNFTYPGLLLYKRVPVILEQWPKNGSEYRNRCQLREFR